MPVTGNQPKNPASAFEALESRQLLSVAAEPLPAAPPPTPGEVDAVLIAPRAAKVTWADVAGETGYVVQRRVDGSSDPWAPVARTDANVVTITNDGLLLGRTYLYRVVAFNAAGESAPSGADAVATPNESDLPPVPTGVKAELVAPRAIKVTWNDVAGETAYVIERRIDGTSDPYARVGSTNAGVTTFTDDGLLAGKTYLYRVRSVNAVGPSSPSAAAFASTPPEGGTTVPATPREFTATLIGPRAVRLNWADVTGETGYRVERRVDGSADDWATVATLAANVTTYAQDGLAAGKTYLYRVRAFNAAGASQPTDARAVTTPGETPGVPAAPHLESVLAAPRAIRLAWTNVSNESGYKIERRVDGSAEPFRQIAVTADEVTRYTDDGLEPGKTYLYRVRAFNAAGNSDYSNTVNRAVPGEVTVPLAPSGVTATLTGPRAVRVTWTDVAGETGYRVERRIDGSAEEWRVVGTVGANDTSFAQDGLLAGKTYLYRVRAFNVAGSSEPSRVAVVRTPGETPAVPSAPHLEASLVAPRAVRLAWTNVSNEKGYLVERRVDGTDGPFRQVAVIADEVTRYVDDGLEPGKTYIYRVRAFNDAGKSAYSNTVAVATQRPGGVVGTGNGLVGTYFDNEDLTDPRLTRVDPTVNFEWGEGSPVPVIDANTFSVRWTGQVQAQFTQTYTFYTRSDDGVRLWANGKLLIDDWTHHAATERSGTIALEAGKKYDIRMEYFEGSGNAMARLLWGGPMTEKQVIPKSQLYSASPVVGPGA